MLNAAELNHFNIATSDLEKSAKFYESLGLKRGYRPDYPNTGIWMYIDDVPRVHLNLESEVGPIVKGTGVVHHVGLSVNGPYNYVIEYLMSIGIIPKPGFDVHGTHPSVYFDGPSGECVELVMVENTCFQFGTEKDILYKYKE